MSRLPLDPEPKFQEYAQPAALVSTEWLAAHLDNPHLVVVESDEDALLYETGHIPGSVKIDWHTELNDPIVRDYVSPERFAALMAGKGISRESTVVFYGDAANWWAAYALWVFRLFGHTEVRLLDGGRQKWVAEGRPLVTTPPARPATVYPVSPRDDRALRIYRDEVLAHATQGGRLVDVRSPEEFRGTLTHMPDYPQEGALRGGHIPGAVSLPWRRATNEDGTFRRRSELRAIYEEEKRLPSGETTVVYCRIGERSSHTWFVLTYLLGFADVRNYDGSWSEWGNVVGLPIEVGDEPVFP